MGMGGGSDFGPGMLPGIPRISLDMPPMEPTRAKTGPTHLEEREGEAERDEDVREDDRPVMPTYARLNSEM